MEPLTTTASTETARQFRWTHSMRISSLTIIAAAVVCATWLTVRSEERSDAAKPKSSAKDESTIKAPETKGDGPHDNAFKEIVSGKVVSLSEALKRHGIKNYPEESK